MKIIEVINEVTPSILYHHTFIENRQNIENFGLLRSYDRSGNEYPGIFLTTHPKFSRGIDVWQVDTQGLTIEPDQTGAFPENPKETWWVDYEEDIPPSHIKLIRQTKTLYHITPARNLTKIMKYGLVPKIGKRSQSIGEPMKGIYLFNSVQEAEDAVMNWLGDQFGENIRLALLAVEVPTDQIENSGAGYETILTAPITPERIRILNSNL